MSKTTNLFEIGLLYGDVLYHYRDDATCTVETARTVIYNGQEMSLSQAALDVTGVTKEENGGWLRNGWHEWMFNGKSLDQRRIQYKKHAAILKMKNIPKKKLTKQDKFATLIELVA
jgi:hypothetical protein